jgi:hypothetical protein
MRGTTTGVVHAARPLGVGFAASVKIFLPGLPDRVLPGHYWGDPLHDMSAPCVTEMKRSVTLMETGVA